MASARSHRGPRSVLAGLVRIYREHRWAVIGLSWAAVFALGYIGARRQVALAGEARSLLDPLYRALQLFMLDDSMLVSPGVPVPWQLEAARFLTPLVAAFTGIAALLAIFRDELEGLRLQRQRGHVVVCGLGRKGALLAARFAERGFRVVAVDPDEDNDNLEHWRARGGLAVVGNATSSDVLRRARVDRAHLVVAVSGDDGANAEIAVRCWELAGGRPGPPLRCLAHIFDPELCSLLRQRGMMSAMAGSFRLEFFSVFDAGALAVLRRHPPFTPPATAPPRVLVVGLGRMGESLAVHAARMWQAQGGAHRGRLRLTVVDRRADVKIESLQLRHPYLEHSCEIIGRAIDARGPEFQRAAFLRAADGSLDLDAAYICLDSDSAALAVALVLVSLLGGRRLPIVVRMTHSGGLTTLLRGGSDGSGAFDNLHAFALLDETCDPDLLLATTHESLARAIHESYLQEGRARGETTSTNPSLVPWEELPADLRESNLRQADLISARLRAIGCTIELLRDWDAERFEFAPDEVERMAEDEHRCWLDERTAAGWRYASGPKDLAARTSPDLLDWRELPEAAREKDRDAVRAIPRLLARAGLQVSRCR